MKVIVTTFHTSDPENPETEQDIDFSVRRNRDWLFGHITWAINNGRGVEVQPDAD
jgi:hypothetical protein